ncbi:MAG: transposase [Gallionella sp.]
MIVVASHPFIGIDLHSNNSVVVTDEAGRIIFQKRLANSLNEILPALAPHREETVGVVVESTYNWYWLVDDMMDAGYQVHLAHPSALKKYEGLKYSGALPMPPILSASGCNWFGAGRCIYCRSRIF